MKNPASRRRQSCNQGLCINIFKSSPSSRLLRMKLSCFVVSIALFQKSAFAFTLTKTTILTTTRERVPQSISSFQFRPATRPLSRSKPMVIVYSDNDKWGANDAENPNLWRSSDEPEISRPEASSADDLDDWQGLLAKKEDGSYWSSFEPSVEDDTDEDTTSTTANNDASEEVDAEAWLDTLASLGAQEIEFNLKEADRADKVRQMEEWGFTADAISSTLGVAVDQSLEGSTEVEGMEDYRQDAYDPYDEVDYTTVESHTRVERDEDGDNEPIRSQHVYVDEVTCIGCTNCASIAQSTFFMEDEHGRARVFEQWGDDEDTIECAIATCPVDCIHYVPYEELERLEIERRGQNINFKARLVNQGEYGGGVGHIVGGASAIAFTGPQQISGNMGSRCNNCPSRGCANCPMYGVGKNPLFAERETKRKAKNERQRITEERSSQNKSADL